MDNPDLLRDMLEQYDRAIEQPTKEDDDEQDSITTETNR